MGTPQKVDTLAKLNLIHKNLPTQKYYVIKFHKFFDALIGTEYLAQCDAVMDYKDKTISLDGIKIKFHRYFPVRKVVSNFVEIKTSSDGDWVLTKPIKFSNETVLQPGLYKSQNLKSMVKISSTESLPLDPYLVKINVNNFDVIEPLSIYENSLSKETMRN